MEWLEKWNSKEHQFATTADKLFGMAEQLVRDDLNHPFTKALDEFITNNEAATEDASQRIAEIIQKRLAFNQHLLRQGIESGEFENHNITHLAFIFESLIGGLSQMSRMTQVADALPIYHSAIQVLLHGIAKNNVWPISPSP